MEITNKIKMNKLKSVFFISSLCIFTNCTKSSYDESSLNHSYYYYPTEEKTITTKQIGDGKGTLSPSGVAIANDKLYVCNDNALEVFNAQTLAHLKTITTYSKGTDKFIFSGLSSVSVDNGRIYIGSKTSRLFVIDEITNAGISMLGNGNWWDTFKHVFGVVAKDGLLFVKEKEQTIKVFETSKITDKSNWNLAPFAKLNTITGWDEFYSTDVADGSLVVAGRNAKGYLYYKITDIRTNAANSLIKTPTPTPIMPAEVTPFSNSLPLAVSIGTDWAITSESEDNGNTNYLRIYPKKEFMNKVYTPVVNATDIMGKNKFGSIVGIAQLNDRFFLSDNKNQKIIVIKLNKTEITEQK